MSESQPPIEATATKLSAFSKRAWLLSRVPWVRPSTSGYTGESYLCNVCERLDLTADAFIVKDGDDEHAQARKFRYLGLLSRIRDKPHCPFCRLILGIADRPPDQRAPSHISDEDPTVYARWVVDGQEDLGQDPKHPWEHIYKARTRRLLVYSEPQTFKDGYVTLLGEDAPFPTFFGRRVLGDGQLDAPLIKAWISKCETHHGLECEESLVHPQLVRERPSVVFRAIDVDDMCITTPPADCRYVALSYLWGRGFRQLFTTSTNLDLLSTPGALKKRSLEKMKERLPKTIKDAIELTRMLGEKYLWTDALALLHDSGFQYHDDWVYARAAITVVAGSGKDADAGLPGVREKSRMFHQDVEECTPGVRLMVCHLAEDYISTSQWDSRAWTFQERMLSRRCLIFVNGRIYYQCRRTTFCEDIDMPVDGWSLDSIDMPTRIFREKPFIQFTSAVELYTRRELTNPTDILNAFEGVQRVLEKRLNATVFYGAMESEMDVSLIWESSQRLVRREPFPSWSWSGWTGEIQWKFTDQVYSWIEWPDSPSQDGNKPAPKVSKSLPPPIPKEPIRTPTLAANLKLEPWILRFQTVSAILQLTAPTLIHKDVVSPLRKRLTGPSALSTVRPTPSDPELTRLIRAGISDRDGKWCGTIDLDEETWKGRIGEPMEFIILSMAPAFTLDEKYTWEQIVPDDVEAMMDRFQYGVYNVLMVTERNGIHYREGLGRILVDSLDRALDPGPVWHEVLLG